ncbi:hypothetical protein [Bacillus cereus]|uniref:hypothetical protein n=1 Tax=Bacillus cereus TaxID=1396 RepID=UPI00027ABBFA|nr:hypothetical protein [Bacillus cereus]EJS72914.1 hypothetical protein ICY_04125 [Bacillus cereus BAG2X1-3]
MNSINAKRFEAVDTILTGFTNFFIVNSVKETPIYKEFEIVGLKDNSEEISKVAAEVNEYLLSRNNEDIVNVLSNPRYIELSDKGHELSEEKICYGKIKKEYNTLTNEIQITIETSSEIKEFTYGQEEVMKDLMDYMQNLHKIAKEEYHK